MLKAIAAGNHKLSTIASVLNAKQTSIIKYLTVLANLDIVERQVPITEENPDLIRNWRIMPESMPIYF